MAKFSIFDPTKGMYTAADQQDLDPRAGFADLIENYYLDRPGKIRMRDMLENVATDMNPALLKGLFRFVDENLSGNAIWIAYTNDNSKDDIQTAAAIANFTKKVVDLDQVAVGKLDIVVVGGKLRLAFGYTSHRIYLYNSITDFFQNQYQPAAAWAWGTKQPTYPSTFTYESLLLESADQGTGVITEGFTSYKVVPVFDGVQEALFAAAHVQYDSRNTITNGEYGILRLIMAFDSDDWLKRITHLNIYRQFNAAGSAVDDALYQKVDTVSASNLDPINSDITDAATMYEKLYDADKSWGVNDYAFDNGVGGGTIGNPGVGDIKYTVEVVSGTEDDIESNTANTLVITDASFPGSTFVNFPDSYTIYKYVCTDAGTWTGATKTTAETGTNGWGGTLAFYSDSSDLDENALKYHILSYPAPVTGGTAYNPIVANTGKVIVLSRNSDLPSTGSGKSIAYAEYLWSYSGTTARLYWCDYGRLDKGNHRQAGVTTITTAAKYNRFWKGRMFGLNARVTKADTTTEDFPDALVYSEVNQLDVSPPDFQIQPPTDQGGIGQGLEIIEEAETLILFFRNNIMFLRVPLADPLSWQMWSSTRDMGLVNPDATIKTPAGIFFCSDEGIYLIDRNGRISIRPLSFPIDDSYKSAVATSVAGFSAMYFPQQRQVWFNLTASDNEVWVLDIDTVNRDVPRWSKYTWADETLDRAAIDESNLLYTFQYGVGGGASINKIGQGFSPDENPGATFRTVYMPLGSTERKHLIRHAIVSHKGVRSTIPTVLLNDGTTSEAKTTIAAVANGENRKVSIKRYASNFALQLVSSVGTSKDHEITSIEMEVEND